MGNITSLIPLGVESCTKTGTKCDNDNASAAAILMLTIATGISALWQAISVILLAVGSGDSIPIDGALGLLFVGIGMSFSISTCYPQQITAGAYTNAICGALLMYDLLIANGINDLFSGIPNIVAVAINATIIWYASSSQESIHTKGENVWRSGSGNPKTLTIIMVVAVGISIVSSVITGAVQIYNDGFFGSAEQWKNDNEKRKLKGDETIRNIPELSDKSHRAIALRYIIICCINVIYSSVAIIMAIIHTSKVWSEFSPGPDNKFIGCDADYSNSKYVAREDYYKAYPIVSVFAVAVNILSAVTRCGFASNKNAVLLSMKLLKINNAHKIKPRNIQMTG